MECVGVTTLQDYVEYIKKETAPWINKDEEEYISSLLNSLLIIDSPRKRTMNPTDSPEYHAIVYINIRSLISDVSKILSNVDLSSDYQYIIRWFYTQGLHSTSGDNLVPSFKGVNYGLYKYLSKYNTPKDIIEKIEKSLQDGCDRITKLVKQINLECGQVRLYHNSNGQIVLSYKIKSLFSEGLLIKFKLTSVYYNKLKSRYTTAKDDIKLFNIRVFNLLCKYNSLYCPGYQAAIKEEMFGLLPGMSHESFASPFNVTLSSYTSMFPDTDTYFGSKGDFFKVYPRLFESGGSFELNPPFIEDHMILMGFILDYTLRTTTAPLSFFVVVPTWTDNLAYLMFKNSKFNVLKDEILFLRNEHYYQHGANYESDERITRLAGGSTSVFILQNDAGKVKYKITPDFIKSFSAIFKTS